MSDRAPLTPEEIARMHAEGEEVRREIHRRIAPMTRGPFGPRCPHCGTVDELTVAPESALSFVRERNALLAALRPFAELSTEDVEALGMEQAVLDARAAIAKAEGKP